MSVPVAEAGTLPRVPVGDWVDTGFDWLKDNVEPVFDAVSTVTEGAVDSLSDGLLFLPPVLFALVLAALGLFARSVVFAVGSLAGLLLIQSMQLWAQAMETLALLLVATLVSMAIAVPLGIAAAKSERVSALVRPVLDFMQTMPAFVYLVPAVTFFGIGLVPGVITTIIFALPPGVRLTELGIRQVDRETVEAGHAFGSSPFQLLQGVELPLARPTIMAGVKPGDHAGPVHGGDRRPHRRRRARQRRRQQHLPSRHRAGVRGRHRGGDPGDLPGPPDGRLRRDRRRPARGPDPPSAP